ncbi:MAG: carboxymuconolactone decarboxylase family protein [Candidatus Hinthialibacter antarcticus]|nr:carboxymuconolactone decarboxylase family protein [Candidatus Hinthialibacter antarcticus]
MPRLKAVQPETTNGKVKEMLDAVNSKLGMIPNLIRTFANSPAVLQAYLDFSGALAGGVLTPTLREQIALVVSQTNQCEYCLSAHSAIGKMLGLSQEEILDNRQATSSNPKTEAALQFSKRVAEKRGFISDDEFKQLQSAGYSDEEIAEIIANISLNLFTNYFNHIAETDIDFPLAAAIKTPKKAAACSC